MASSSFSRTPRPALALRRPSTTARRSFTLSIAERGDGASAADHIEEEIAEIKRYEDFTTIDWVQDAAREQARRSARYRRNAGLYDPTGRSGWRHRLAEAYDAAQGWIVVTIIGACIGLNAALLSIVTEWLSDIKLGYCDTAFYLNENFCCWGEENGCENWHRWTGFGPLDYLVYVLFATTFAFISAFLVKSYAPYAAGSGISEIKCIVAGFVMKGFLGLRTLLIKSVCLPFAIASGLSVGKEGPSVHYAVCTGNVVSRLFDKYRRNASKTREIFSACAAAGVAVAFGSPIGGVLFSLEEISSYFPLKTMWRSYFCALVATAVLAAMNPFRTGALVTFQVRYDRSWHFFEVLFYVVVGVFGGLYGAVVIRWNLRAQRFRKRYLAGHAVLEAVVLAAATAVVCYPNAFLRIDMTESMEVLFLECEGPGEKDYRGLCDADRRLANVASLVLATVVRLFFVVVSYGSRVPAGIFVPSMAIGASFGRTVGIAVQALHEAAPQSVFFAACKPDEPCITPGTYAFLGAAAALSGIMHITVSVVVIMFELTGALTYILPTMIVVGVTKAVSERFGKGGIADRMIWFSGFPFLDNKEEHNLGVPVSHVMRRGSIERLPVSGLTLADVERLLADNRYQGFPVVEDPAGANVLVGYVGRTELRYAIDRVRRERRAPVAPTTECIFSAPAFLRRPGPAASSSAAAAAAAAAALVTPVTPTVTIDADSLVASLDLSRYVDATPVTVHPRLPLETVMELFRKIGPRVILIEHHGRLAGLVTVKDCLKYQFKVEAHENPRDDGDDAEGEEWLAGCLQRAAAWVSRRVSSVSGGRIRLGGQSRPLSGGGGGGVSGAGTGAGAGGAGSPRHRILDGDEDSVDDLELENRVA